MSSTVGAIMTTNGTSSRTCLTTAANQVSWAIIYYSDTVRFYKQYRQEINALLYELMDSTGLYAPSELFGNKWDKEDPLAQDDYNQNLLAWFGFEETLRNIGYNFETLQDCI